MALSMIQALWYSSLILSVTAVCIGLCQSVFLARLGCIANGNMILRDILIDKALRSGRCTPRKTQNLVWLLAVGLLEWSIYLWLAGYLVFLWEATKMRQLEQSSGDVVVSA
jgi:hypothetical protein